MEAGADTQQSGETAVSESEAQQITLAQVNLIITLNVHFFFFFAKKLLQVLSEKKSNCYCGDLLSNFAYRHCMAMHCRHP